jgi:hypothetical protein
MARKSDTLRQGEPSLAPIVGAQVTVSAQDGSLLSLTTDDRQPLSNPVITDQFGSYYFNIGAPAFVDLRTYFGGRLVREDFGVPVGITPTTIDQAAASASASAAAAVQAALNADVVLSQSAASTATTQATNAAASAASIGNAKALTSALGLASDVVQTGADIVATQTRRVGKDDNSFVATSGRSLFPAGARVFGSWSATHRGMQALIAGKPSEVYEVSIPAGSVIGDHNAKIYIGIVTPTAPLPLAATAVTFSNPRVVGMVDFTSLPTQTLGNVLWRGVPVGYADGDLLVYWGVNVQFLFGTNVGVSHPTDNAYDGWYHFVYSIPGANDETALGTGFTVTPFPASGSNALQFPYVASVGAGPVRASMGGANSYALVGADGKLSIDVIPSAPGGSAWSGRKVGIMGTSIETETGGHVGQIGWARKTLTALNALGTVGGVGSSLFCFIGNQGGGGDALSFSGTPAELSGISGDPANSFQSKCYDKGFDLLVIGGGVINDVERNNGTAFCAIGTQSDNTPGTIWGAFNRVIQGIQTNSPACEIVIQGTQHQMRGAGGTVTEWAQRSVYNEALRAIAKAYKLPFLDFLNMSGITLSNYMSRLVPDSGAYIHPLQIQQDQMARQATAFLNGL